MMLKSLTAAAPGVGWLKPLFVIGSVAAVLGLAYAADDLVAARDVAANAARDLSACEKLADQVHQLRGEPVVVGAVDVDPAVVASRIEKSAVAAGIPASALREIVPSPTQRVEHGPYVERSIAVSLTGVGLRPLVVFLQHITSNGADPRRFHAHSGSPRQFTEAPLMLRDLRLSLPADKPASSPSSVETWACDATLVYRIYNPLPSPDSRYIGE